MKVVRRMGGTLLWVLAVIGALSGAVFVAHALGWVQPLVVVSGSMEPEIRRGDLIITLPVPVAEVQVGEVTTLRNEVTGRLVTHRVIAVNRVGADYAIEMQGDANGVPDPAPYRVNAADSVLQPRVTIPAAGDVVLALARPTVAIPLAIAVLALIGFSLVPSRSPARHLPTGEESA
jgi:signal peptidase